MVLLDNDQFLSQLSKGFENTKKTGTVFLTMKRYIYTPKSKSELTAEHVESTEMEVDAPESTSGTTTDDGREYPCLIRAVIGKKGKISTIVEPADSPRFLNSYSTIIKAHMHSLRKKEKKDKKDKSKLKNDTESQQSGKTKRRRRKKPASSSGSTEPKVEMGG
ncbi:signal recognition particle 14kD protein-domain-containing protein [Paraphysoderma sedebokerense]|nr:signal recognition particle 14kD protein-domain-containing protein [Paraphysoderma sedebokerense]